jgi:carbon storage regulator CsrA
MLVMTRREGEEIVIGDPANPIAVVQLVSIRGDRCRIGVEAGPSVPVHRREIALQVADQMASGARESAVGCGAKPCGQPVQNQTVAVGKVGSNPRVIYPATDKPTDRAVNDSATDSQPTNDARPEGGELDRHV